MGWPDHQRQTPTPVNGLAVQQYGGTHLWQAPGDCQCWIVWALGIPTALRSIRHGVRALSKVLPELARPPTLDTPHSAGGLNIQQDIRT
jgi:hypothetical protein